MDSAAATAIKPDIMKDPRLESLGIALVLALC